MDQQIHNRQHSPIMTTVMTEEDCILGLQQPPASPSQAHRTRQTRQSKRLSLNFPILVPSSNVRTKSQSASPSNSIPSPSIHRSSHLMSSPSHTHNMSAPSTTTLPLTPPSEMSEDGLSQPTRSPSRVVRKGSHRRSQSAALHQLNTSSPPDILTLLASQERRVMELKEELASAESELMTLKKSWAIHEASRKKVEIKAGSVRRTPSLKSSTAIADESGHIGAASHVTGNIGLGLDSLDGEESEEARRELVKQKLLRRGTLESLLESPGNTNKKSGQRVFSGSRHTRALSLLTTTNVAGGRKNSADGNVNTRTSSESASPFKASFGLTTSPVQGKDSFDFTSPSLPSLSRSNTVISSSGSKDAPSLNFGKTYKELASAASKRNIPQGLQIVNGSAEILVKQGKTVVDGIGNGLWTFFEDLRQVTVGEEAAMEAKAIPKRQPSEPGMSRKKSIKKSNSKDKEPSFWKEFGIDTPQGDKSKRASPSEETTPVVCHKHHPQGHTRNFSKPLALRDGPSPSPSRNASIAPVSTNPDDAPIEPDLLAPEELLITITPTTTTSPTKIREHEHTPQSSTDSGTSRSTPPSIFSDVPVAAQGEHENEEESWEWGSVESPTSVRFRSSESATNSKKSVGGEGERVVELLGS